jgi:hypothetical protein
LELPILFSKTTSLDSTIDKPVKEEMSEFMAPTLWSSIAMLTSMIHDTQSQVQANAGSVALIKNEVSNEVFENIDQSVIRPVVDNANSLRDSKGLVAKSLNQIANRFQHKTRRSEAMYMKLSAMERNQMCNSGASLSNQDAMGAKEYADAQINVVQELVGNLNRKLDEIIADTHQDAIKFNGFGFRRFDEASAWLEAHSPGHKFGLIVDAHMVFEHLHSEATKTVPTLQQLRRYVPRNCDIIV